MHIFARTLGSLAIFAGSLAAQTTVAQFDFENNSTVAASAPSVSVTDLVATNTTVFGSEAQTGDGWLCLTTDWNDSGGSLFFNVTPFPGRSVDLSMIGWSAVTNNAGLSDSVASIEVFADGILVGTVSETTHNTDHRFDLSEVAALQNVTSNVQFELRMQGNPMGQSAYEMDDVYVASAACVENLALENRIVWLPLAGPDNDLWRALDGASFRTFEDGTAELKAAIVNESDPELRLSVCVQLSGRVDGEHPPAGSPRLSPNLPVCDDDGDDDDGDDDDGDDDDGDDDDGDDDDGDDDDGDDDDGDDDDGDDDDGDDGDDDDGDDDDGDDDDGDDDDDDGDDDDGDDDDGDDDDGDDDDGDDDDGDDDDGGASHITSHGPQDDCIDPSKWHYYTHFTGTLTGRCKLQGFTATISRRGAALQIGRGANLKDLSFGLASWFDVHILTQAPTCPIHVDHGDFNLTLGDSCECFGGGIASWENYGVGVAGCDGVPSFTVPKDPLTNTAIDFTVGNESDMPVACAVLLSGAAGEFFFEPLQGTFLIEFPTLVDTNLVVPPGGGVTSCSVPEDPCNVGVCFFLQALCLDPCAPAGIAFSRGLKVTIGDL